jgi:hypothetical protein
VAKTGKQPKILTIPNDLGHREPWYQSRRYDPWNDYGRTGGFGGFGLMDYLLVDNLLDNDRRYNTTTIFAQDPGYSQRFSMDAAGAAFTDSTWLQPESGEGTFFGSGFDEPGSGPERGEGDFNRDDS